MSADSQFSVSVVIPAYNAEQQIQDAIESILAQSCGVDEIIVVDDGSTDRTAEIVKAYPQVHYIYQKNAGVSAACNTGIENAKYRWIAFLDSDDVWLPEKWGTQKSLLCRNPDLKWVMCNYYIHDYEQDKKSLCIDIDKARRFLNGKERYNFFDGITAGVGWVRCCTVAERDTLKKAGLFRQGYSAGEDLDLFIRVAFTHPEVGFIEQAQAEYSFRREGSISSQSYAERVRQRCLNLEILLDQSKQYGKTKELQRAANKLLINWIRQLWGNEEERQLIREILSRFKEILPLNYKVELRLKTMFPYTGWLFKIYFKLKRGLGICRNK